MSQEKYNLTEVLQSEFNSLIPESQAAYERIVTLINTMVRDIGTLNEDKTTSVHELFRVGAIYQMKILINRLNSMANEAVIAKKNFVDDEILVLVLHDLANFIFLYNPANVRNYVKEFAMVNQIVAEDEDVFKFAEGCYNVIRYTQEYLSSLMDELLYNRIKNNQTLPDFLNQEPNAIIQRVEEKMKKIQELEKQNGNIVVKDNGVNIEI